MQELDRLHQFIKKDCYLTEKTREKLNFVYIITNCDLSISFSAYRDITASNSYLTKLRKKILHSVILENVFFGIFYS